MAGLVKSFCVHSNPVVPSLARWAYDRCWATGGGRAHSPAEISEKSMNAGRWRRNWLDRVSLGPLEDPRGFWAPAAAASSERAGSLAVLGRAGPPPLARFDADMRLVLREHRGSSVIGGG